jgi:dolichol-phosphate mannosyltransferase
MPASVSFVLPAHNEADIIADTVHAVAAIGDRAGWEYEIVVVENGSTDTTWELVTVLARTLPTLRAVRSDVADYGAALATGLRHATNDVAVVFDCDLYDDEFAYQAYDSLAKNERAAVVVASKRHPDSHDTRPLLRRAGTAVFTAVLHRMCGLRASDTHGMKAVALHRVRTLVSACRSTGHCFDTELVLRAERDSWEIVELPCNVEELRPARSSYLSRVPSALMQAWQLRRMLGDEPT